MVPPRFGHGTRLTVFFTFATPGDMRIYAAFFGLSVWEPTGMDVTAPSTIM